MNKTRRFLFRAGAVLLLLLIAGLMFLVGRGHTIYLDNKTMEYNGETYDSPYKVVVTVGGEQAAKLYAKERGKTLNIGQKFSMDLEITETKGGSEETTTITLRLPYRMDGIILNLPALLAGLPEDAYLSEFITVPVEEVVEEPVTDEFGIQEEDLAPEG